MKSIIACSPLPLKLSKFSKIFFAKMLFLSNLKHIVNSRIHRLEFELKVAREIEETNKIVYQLEILECCRIVINRYILESTRKEDSISPFC